MKLNLSNDSRNKCKSLPFHLVAFPWKDVRIKPEYFPLLFKCACLSRVCINFSNGQNEAPVQCSARANSPNPIQPTSFAFNPTVYLAPNYRCANGSITPLTRLSLNRPAINHICRHDSIHQPTVGGGEMRTTGSEVHRATETWMTNTSRRTIDVVSIKRRIYQVLIKIHWVEGCGFLLNTFY